MTENDYCSRLFAELIQTQKRYTTFLEKMSILTCHIKPKMFLLYKLLNTVTDWGSMGCVIKLTSGRAFKTLGRTF